MNNISSVFNSVSKNLNDSKKHFQKIELHFSKNLNLTEDELTINDNLFTDITFRIFLVMELKRLAHIHLEMRQKELNI